MSKYSLNPALAPTAALLMAALTGCSKPPPAPPQDAPWLDPKQQIKLLDQKDDRLRMMAARNLGNLGAQAAPAIPQLEAMTDDRNPKVSQHAREALEKIRAAIERANE